MTKWYLVRWETIDGEVHVKDFDTEREAKHFLDATKVVLGSELKNIKLSEAEKI